MLLRALPKRKGPKKRGWHFKRPTQTEALEAMIAERKTAEQRATVAMPQSTPGGDRKSEQFQGAIGTLKRGSTSPEYLTARIARDRPDILDRMKAGDYKRVRAAGKDGRERA